MTTIRSALEFLQAEDKAYPVTEKPITSALEFLTDGERSKAQPHNSEPSLPGADAPIADSPPARLPEDGLIAAIRKGVENIPQHLKASAGGLLQAIGEQDERQAQFKAAGERYLNADNLWESSKALGDVVRYRPGLLAGTPEGEQLKEKGKAMADEAQDALKENAFQGTRGVPYYTNAVVEGLGSVALPVVAGIVNPKLGATLMAGQVYGEKYAEQRKKGRGELEAAQDATFYALSEAIPEKFVFESFLRGGRGLLKKVFKGALTEGAQESLTEALQAGYDAGILKEDMSFKEAVRRVIDAGLVGFFTGGPMAAALHPFSRERETASPRTPQPPTHRPAPEERAINTEDLLGEVISPAANEGALLGTLNPPEGQSTQREEPPQPTLAEESKPDEVNANPNQAQTTQGLASTLTELGLPPEEVAAQLQTARELGLTEPSAREGTPAQKQATAPLEVQGKAAQVVTAKGTPVDIQYALANADALTSSHDARGNINPSFPQALQPRDRSRDSSVAQIARIAGNLKPELLAESPKAADGAPMVSPEGIVESGNGRVAALRRHYRQGGNHYKRYLMDNAKRFGLDPQAIERMPQPILVRVRQTPMDEAQRAEFARAANQADLAPLSPLETAKADAERITPEMMAAYAPSDNGNVLAASNQSFLKAFSQAIGPEETAGLTASSGHLTRQMADRVQAAVFQKAYGNEHLLNLFAEEADPEIKNILSALNRAAPAFAKARAVDETLGDVDIVTPLVEAIETLTAAKREGTHIKEVIAQQDAFTQRNPTADKLALFMAANQRSAKRLGAWLTHMGERVEATLKSRQNETLFDLPPINTETIADEAIQRFTPKQTQANLFRPGAVQPNDAPSGQPSQPTEGGRAEAYHSRTPESSHPAQATLAPQQAPQETTETTTQRYPKQAALKAKAQRKRTPEPKPEISLETPEPSGVSDSGGKVIHPAGKATDAEQTPLLSRAEAKSQGVNRDHLVKHAASLMRAWQNRPAVKVLSRFDELPEAVRKAALKVSDGADIEGVFWKGQVYLVAENIQSTQRAEKVLFHEILGHYGLRGMLGEQLTPLLNQVYLASGRSGLQEIAKRYGLDLNTREGRLTAAEEKLAHLAQTNEKPKLLQKLYALLRDWLRQMGFTLTLNEADIARLLEKAARFVREGRAGKLTDLEKIPLFQQVFQGASTQAREKEGTPHYARKQPPVLFRPEPEEAQSYRAQLKKTMVSRQSNVPPLELGRTPLVLRALGAKDLPMAISRDVVRKATNGVKHTVPMDAIEQLPEELHDPLLVFNSKTQANALVALTEYHDANGSPVVVALDLRPTDKSYEINRIASVYGRKGRNPLVGWIKEGKLAYKSERADKSPVLKGLQLPNSVSGKTSPKTILDESDIKSTLDAQNATRFSRRLEEATEQNPPDLRTRSSPRSELTRAPIDRVYQAAFELAHIPKLTQAAEKKLTHLMTTAQFKEEGKLSWLNPMIETARAGLIDRYGLSEAYKARERARDAQERKIALKGAELVRTLQASGVDNLQEAKALQAVLTGEAMGDRRMRALSAPVREALDQLGQEAVTLGLLDEATYEKNKLTYLHRVYQKHEAEQPQLGQWVGKMLASRRRKIIGNTFKGRGMTFKVEQSRLIDADGQPLFGRGVPGEHVVGGRPRKFVVLDRIRDGKVLGRQFLPAEDPRLAFFSERETLPEELQGWIHRGTWEVRGKRGGKVTLWRDFTQAERQQMGEILDARYTIGKTFLLMAQDLANGRFLKDISENPEWTWQHAGEPDGLVGEASARYGGYTQYEWVRVPETTIPNTGGKKAWGHLAGKYVRAEIWRDLNQLQQMQSPGLWRKMLTQWKLNKTARNPVVHMNNVMSNLMLMDLAGVHLRDLKRAVYAMRHHTEDYQEALEQGAFGGNFVTQEIQREVLNPILDEVLRQNFNDQGWAERRIGAVGKLVDSLYRGLKQADQKMISAYQLEDEFFRMAVYLRRRAEGMEAAQAGSEAREQFLNYDIRAPWVNAARNTVLPFASYTYRAVPVLAKTLAERPWKLAKYFTLAYVANAMAYALMPGDEEKERKSLREEAQGSTWLGVPRMLRLPIKDQYHNPLFLDIRRWIPAGDIFDMNQGQSALPLPAWVQMGGPIMLAGEFMLNKTAFTGKAIANYKTDTFGEKALKTGDWLWKSWMPSAPWIYDSWYWDKISQSLSGARDVLGRRYEPGYALASSLGIKISPQDVDLNMMWKLREFESNERELKGQRTTAQRDYARREISAVEYRRELANIERKLKQLAEKKREVFE